MTGCLLTQRQLLCGLGLTTKSTAAYSLQLLKLYTVAYVEQTE